MLKEVTLIIYSPEKVLVIFNGDRNLSIHTTREYLDEFLLESGLSLESGHEVSNDGR